jgi:hypothetical protein
MYAYIYICPSGGECNGVSLRTAGNLKGAKWEAFGYRMYLKGCPAGYKLFNRTGYELQVSVALQGSRLADAHDLRSCYCEADCV